ncbi:hypothetical protein GCM10007424_25080 [Flavobacterium suaedae]|uniref:DUF4270 family protein n=1 Tax=Flavobacterium suaedae TaxID=1767027 RepID=A0ABQ1K3E8_9FLAO|nr:hypothetical protein [Flavobacterium suaedae]GGB84059.1 hypothetical protein GCM10007424_25080 [Flavobacterium suaedae]
MIVFSPSINAHALRMAYNNDIVRFYSNLNIEAEVESCTITDSFGSVYATIYPNPQSRFYFNFKPYISTLVNTKNFEDTMQPDIDSGSPSSFTYFASNGRFTQRNIAFSIKFSDGTTDTDSYVLSWLAGVQQPGDFKEFSLTDFLILSPFKPGTANNYYMKYWEGYPFDIPYFNNTNGVLVTNNTNLLSQEFDTSGYSSSYCTRLVVSDGRTNITLEDLLPLANGVNQLTFTQRTSGMLPGSPTFSGNEKMLTLEKVPYTCGVYLKWFNVMGGFNYWLFEDTYSITRKTKHLGTIDNDFENINKTFSRSVSTGKESQDSIKVVAELLTEDERSVIEGILDSPKVYLFTGQPFAQNGYNNWIEVSLKTSSATIKNPRNKLTNFSFELELPERYTQTL